MQSVPAAESIFEPMRDNEQNSLNPCTGQDKAMLASPCYVALVFKT